MQKVLHGVVHRCRWLRWSPCIVLLACSRPPDVVPSVRPPTRAEPTSDAPRADAGEQASTARNDAGAATPIPARDRDAGAGTEPPPDVPGVKVFNIGMHVAGGPFDEATKEPFLRAVEPRYPELARCWRYVNEPKVADVGVDLLIPAEGGRPKVSNPRSTVRGVGFLPCVVAFFETVEFDPPRGGKRGVSYSVRFKPAGAR